VKPVHDLILDKRDGGKATTKGGLSDLGQTEREATAILAAGNA